MKIIQLYVLMCCQAAVADQLTDLGSDVSINCDLDEKEVYWILLKTPDPPIVILRSFSASQSSPHYSHKTFRKKYSVQFKHCLVINNITADELGVYYCMNTDTPPKFSNSSRISITESTQRTDHTVVEFSEQNNTTVNHTEQKQTQWRIIILISALMNGLLVFVLIVFAAGNTKCSEKHLHDSDQLETHVIYQPQDPKLKPSQYTN